MTVLRAAFEAGCDGMDEPQVHVHTQEPRANVRLKYQSRRPGFAIVCRVDG